MRWEQLYTRNGEIFWFYEICASLCGFHILMRLKSAGTSIGHEIYSLKYNTWNAFLLLIIRQYRKKKKRKISKFEIRLKTRIKSFSVSKIIVDGVFHINIFIGSKIKIRFKIFLYRWISRKSVQSPAQSNFNSSFHLNYDP